MRERVRGLQRRDDAFELAQQLEGVERLVVGDRTYSTRPMSCSQECSGPMPG
jgi:hypothetical protein